MLMILFMIRIVCTNAVKGRPSVDHVAAIGTGPEFFYEKSKVMLEVAMKGMLNSPGCMYCYMLIVLGRFSQSQVRR